MIHLVSRLRPDAIEPGKKAKCKDLICCTSYARLSLCATKVPQEEMRPRQIRPRQILALIVIHASWRFEKDERSRWSGGVGLVVCVCWSLGRSP